MRYINKLMPILFLTLWALAMSPVYAAETPLAEVQSTVDQVIEVLRDKQLRGESRRQTLSSLIRARFDFVIMSQRTLGKYWKTATDAEQQRFVDLFSDLLEASYIGRIEAYSDETVSYGEQKIEQDRAEVATLVHSGNTSIPIVYRLVQQRGGWFVYDVIVEEVSLIRNYRSSYGEIVRKDGFSGLFLRMDEKIRDLNKASDQKVAQ